MIEVFSQIVVHFLGCHLAVAIEFVNVILRKTAIECKFPGGLDGFARQDLANFFEDDYLVRVGFMSTSDALQFVDDLEAAGLRIGNDDESDIAVVMTDTEVRPPWLTMGLFQKRWACWLNHSPPGKLVDFEPGMLFRCPRRLYMSIDEKFQQCGSIVHRSESRDEAVIAVLTCERGESLITVQVIGERLGDSPVVFWGRRDFARRSYREVDIALMCDLVEILIQNGGEKLSGSA